MRVLRVHRQKREQHAARGGRHEERNEHAAIPSTNAIAHEGAVMVQAHYAHVALLNNNECSEADNELTPSTTAMGRLTEQCMEACARSTRQVVQKRTGNPVLSPSAIFCNSCCLEPAESPYMC